MLLPFFHMSTGQFSEVHLQGQACFIKPSSHCLTTSTLSSHLQHTDQPLLRSGTPPVRNGFGISLRATTEELTVRAYLRRFIPCAHISLFPVSIHCADPALVCVCLCAVLPALPCCTPHAVLHYMILLSDSRLHQVLPSLPSVHSLPINLVIDASAHRYSLLMHLCPRDHARVRCDQRG